MMLLGPHMGDLSEGNLDGAVCVLAVRPGLEGPELSGMFSFWDVPMRGLLSLLPL